MKVKIELVSKVLFSNVDIRIVKGNKHTSVPYLEVFGSLHDKTRARVFRGMYIYKSRNAAAVTRIVGWCGGLIIEIERKYLSENPK